MTRRCLMLALLIGLPLASQAQSPDNSPISDYLRRSYAAAAKDFSLALETMPEQDFDFRPAGAVKEVRTFGEIAAHLALVNSFVCAMGDGKPDVTATPGFKVPVDKPGVIALANSVNARCTGYLATLTDSILTQNAVSGSGDRAIEAMRGNAVIFAIAHSNEHYGNLVTYLRARGLVPPAAAAQVAPFGRVPAKP